MQPASPTRAMANANYARRDKEQELRERIQAGLAGLADYRALRDILDEAGRGDEALAVFEQALDLPVPATEKATALAEMASMLYWLGRRERAINMAEAALSQVAAHGGSPEALMVRGLSHATLANCLYPADRGASRRYAGLAIESFEQLLRDHLDFEELVAACLHAAGVHMLQQNYARAADLYREAMRRDPSERNILHCLVWLGSALRSEGRYAEAEGRLREALDTVEADRRALPRVYFELGMVQRLTNRPEEAMVSFERALAALDFNPALRADRDFLAEVKWELGHLYYSAGRYREAISAFREALPNLPEPYPYWYALTSLGHCYLASRQDAQARDCYEEVLAAERASDEDKAAAREGLSRLPPAPPPTIH